MIIYSMRHLKTLLTLKCQKKEEKENCPMHNKYAIDSNIIEFSNLR